MTAKTLTGLEVVELAAPYVGQTLVDSDDLKALSLPWINTALQEMLPTENILREADGEELLSEAPWMQSLSETIPYHSILLRQALPYWLACSYLQDDDKDTRAVLYYNRYVDALAQAGGMICGEVEDVYADES